MTLPVNPPVAPMLAKLSREMPVSEGLTYEPKWDGFRCIIFKDGDDVELGSRNERPLTRYFPEVVAAARSILPSRCVLDGEIVIASGSGLDFDALLNRIHPADSRVRMLAETTPASFVAFDILCLSSDDLRPLPFRERRAILEGALSGVSPPMHLTPATRSVEVARDWFSRFEGAGLDGVVAKGPSEPYLEGKRAMIKVKHMRTCDCVVAGFRWHKTGGERVGSLLLGLYDGSGVLHHVGVTATFTDKRRLELVAELAPFRMPSMAGHPWDWRGGDAEDEDSTQRVPGAQSRWSAGRDLSFEPLRPELVCEVAFDHLQSRRFRHATTFVRWRPERDGATCRYDQLEEIVPEELAAVFGASSS